MVTTPTRPNLVAAETRDGVRILTLNNPPVNAISAPLAAQLLEQIEAADADESVRAVVVTGANGLFSGGADINEFLQPPPPGAKNVRHPIAAVERSDKTFVVAIDGNALGGGFEFALACDYRLASATARVGLPEIKLGIIPGAGGTQRLPRLIGAQIALDFMLKGELKTAKQAKAMGVLDEVVEVD